MGITTEFSLKDVCAQFNVETTIEGYGNGHINDTYLCEAAPRVILQRINIKVFKNPAEVMENIYNVTEHLKKKIAKNGGNPDRDTLNVIRTKDGKNYYKLNDFHNTPERVKQLESAISKNGAGRLVAVKN